MEAKSRNVRMAEMESAIDDVRLRLQEQNVAINDLQEDQKESKTKQD